MELPNDLPAEGAESKAAAFAVEVAAFARFDGDTSLLSTLTLPLSSKKQRNASSPLLKTGGRLYVRVVFQTYYTVTERSSTFLFGLEEVHVSVLRQAAQRLLWRALQQRDMGAANVVHKQ